MSTYETTAGLGDERVRILPRRGLVKKHYYTRATHGIVEVMWSNRGAFVERGFLSWVPENYGFLGRAEALVARRFSGAVSAMRPKCRMRVQNYYFFVHGNGLSRMSCASVSDLVHLPAVF